MHQKHFCPKNNGNSVIGAGCMAALDAEHYLQEVGFQEGKAPWLSGVCPELKRCLIRSNVWLLGDWRKVFLNQIRNLTCIVAFIIWLLSIMGFHCFRVHRYSFSAVTSWWVLLFIGPMELIYHWLWYMISSFVMIQKYLLSFWYNCFLLILVRKLSSQQVFVNLVFWGLLSDFMASHFQIFKRLDEHKSVLDV